MYSPIETEGYHNHLELVTTAIMFVFFNGRIQQALGLFTHSPVPYFAHQQIVHSTEYQSCGIKKTHCYIFLWQGGSYIEMWIKSSEAKPHCYDSAQIQLWPANLFASLKASTSCECADGLTGHGSTIMIAWPRDLFQTASNIFMYQNVL